MKFSNPKSVKDFTGLALPKKQLLIIKGGNDAAKVDGDWIVIDDLING